ncbi:MAG: ArsR family transcriptional regulator, partial [Thermoplasmata archaeon]
MKKLEQRLSFLLLGQGGGENRARIIELLKDRPYNKNQISDKLDLNYQTVEHHVKKLVEHDILIQSEGGDYGRVYFLNKRLEDNFEIFEKLSEKIKRFTASPVLLKNLLKQSDVGFIITDV